MKDMKEALGNARKPDITHVRKTITYYIARACEYGTAKGYERANFLRETDGPKEDFERLREYLRADLGHLEDCLEAMEKHLRHDPDLEDIEGMRRAAYAMDMDSKEGCATGPSRLPHVCGHVASAMIALSQAAMCGLLPEDPGTPWVDNVQNADGTWQEYPGPHKAAVERKDRQEAFDKDFDPATYGVKKDDKQAPHDGRPRCEHALLIGAHCLHCPEGRAKITPRCPHNMIVGKPCHVCAGGAGSTQSGLKVNRS